MPTTAWAFQVRVRRQKLNSGLPCEWQEHKYLIHHLLLSRMHIIKKQELEVVLQFELVWHVGILNGVWIAVSNTCLGVFLCFGRLVFVWRLEKDGYMYVSVGTYQINSNGRMPLDKVGTIFNMAVQYHAGYFYQNSLWFWVTKKMDFMDRKWVHLRLKTTLKTCLEASTLGT